MTFSTKEELKVLLVVLKISNIWSVTLVLKEKEAGMEVHRPEGCLEAMLWQSQLDGRNFLVNKSTKK